MVGFMKSALKVLGIKKESESLSLEEFLEGLPHVMGYNVHFTKQEAEDESVLHFEVEGQEAEKFLGGNSGMLDALAHLSMRVLRRQEGMHNSSLETEKNPERFRVNFDSNGFRAQKREELKVMAEKMRKKVLDNEGKPAYISALSPSERKVIHTHLVELGEVKSESIGNGTFKRIRVTMINPPRRKARSSKEGRPNNKRSDGNFNRNFNTAPKQEKFNDVNGNVKMPEKEEVLLDENIGNRIDDSGNSSSSF